MVLRCGDGGGSPAGMPALPGWAAAKGGFASVAAWVLAAKRSSSFVGDGPLSLALSARRGEGIRGAADAGAGVAAGEAPAALAGGTPAPLACAGWKPRPALK